MTRVEKPEANLHPATLRLSEQQARNTIRDHRGRSEKEIGLGGILEIVPNNLSTTVFKAVGRPNFLNFVDCMSFFLIKLVDSAHLKKLRS
jgi:hypothetical protein